MSEFINTIDALGDEVVVKSIVGGTITEFKDDKLKKVGAGCFFGCSKLTNVVLKSASIIESEAFARCELLATVDLTSVTSIEGDAFYRSSALATLIIRSEQVCTLGKNALNSTQISLNKGYIYVNDNLVDQYKTAYNWDAYASRIKPISELGE